MKPRFASPVDAGGARHVQALDERTWELALTRYFLSSEGPFGASSLTYIDATPPELANAIGEPTADHNEVRERFLAVFRRDSRLGAVLGGHRQVGWADGEEAPGFFRYLVLTCFVPAAEGTGSNEFQARFGELLGIGRPFNHVNAIADLWRRLGDWCDRRRAKGVLVRRVILPDPGGWSRIGHSIRLSFPTWRDRQRLTRLIDEIPATELRSPQKLIGVLRQFRLADDLNGALGLAYDDFRDRYAAGDRLLGEHRFWRLAASLVDRRDTVSVCRKEREWRIDLVFGLDEDVEAELIVGDDGEELPACGRFSEIAETAISDRTAPAWLSGAMERGILLFTERAWGRWSSSATGPKPGNLITMVATQSVRNRLGANVAVWRRLDGIWNLSDPIDGEMAGRLLRNLVDTFRGVIGSTEGSELASLRWVDAVRTGSAILGRTTVLPSVCGTDNAVIGIMPIGDAMGTPEMRRADGASIWRIASSVPLRGRFEVSAVESDFGGRSPLETARLIVFDDRAAIHEELAAPDARPDIRRPEVEIVASGSRPIFGDGYSQPSPPSAVVPPEGGLVDLGEAIYAIGRRGLTEQKLVGLCRRIVPIGGPWAWDVLRMFQEAGWIESRLANRWRARTWYLRPPRLVRFATREGVSVADGAIPIVLREQFVQAAADVGGRAWSMADTSPWTLPVLGASGADVVKLAEKLGWTVSECPTPCFASAPTCWPEERRDATNRERKSIWDWRIGCFSENQTDSRCPVVLSRWWRQDDADLFVVEDGSGRAEAFGSRVSAIIEAHRIAGRRLLKRCGDRMVRNTREGFLPYPVARALRFALLAPAGPHPSMVGGPGASGWTWSYPVDSLRESALRVLFGSAVTDERRDDLPDIAIRRHRGMSRRDIGSGGSSGCPRVFPRFPMR